MTDSARWKRLRKLFEEALEQPPETRSAFLEKECGGDTPLKAELEALLAADAAPDSLRDAVAHAAESFIAGADPGPIAGRRIGAYRIVRELGRGGMGRVFLAERDDRQYAGRVAVKLLAGSGPGRGLEERFRTETQVLADLRHDGIARLLDAGTTADGDSYLVMEYVDGEPIDVFCDGHRLTVDERLALFRRLCDAVQHAHRNLVVHRDIKSSNVLVTAEGEPKLLDFGIAKLLDLDRARALDLHRTSDVTRMLTPTTASPEQLRGEPVTTATDVYALGHLLYGLLTGRSPHPAAATDRFALPQAILNEEPLRPSLAVQRDTVSQMGSASREWIAAQRGTTPERLARRLDGDLDTIVLKALRKEPERRYTTPSQLGEDIERHVEHRPVLARGESVGYVTRRFLQRHRRPVAAGVAGLLLVIALVGFYTARLAIERDRARVEARRAEEVASFLTQLFEVATPDESRGAEITAREVLDRGAAQIGTELRGEPAVQAALMRVIGSAYGKLGLYGPATTMLERALATRHSLAGAPDPVLGDALHELGAVLLVQARYAEAEAVLHRALEARRSARGPIHGDIASTLRSLATLKLALADYGAAARYLDEAEAVARALDPPDDLPLADVLLARGDLFRAVGDYDQAIANQRQAIEVRTRASGFDHPGTLGAQSNLADTLNVAGRTGEAEAVLRDILEIRRRVLPPGHTDIAYALTNLAASLKMQGRPEEAEPLQAEALALFRAAHGADHPATATALNNLANLRHDLRDLDGAFALHQDSLAMKRRLYGDDHPSLADSYNNLAALQLDREDYEGALLMYRQALELDRRSLGDDHPYVGHDLTSIGVTLGLLDRLDEAEETLRSALAESGRTAGDDHPQVANAMRELGIVLQWQDRCDEAEPLLTQALPLLEAAYPGDPWETANTRAYLGACRAALGRTAEAEPLLRAGYRRLLEVRGADNRLTRKARELLIEFLRNSGRDSEADGLQVLSGSSPG
jgi:serine/threonine-protein kinase